MAEKKRVIVYIDGFNLYYGLIDKEWRKYIWLNLKELSFYLAPRDQIVIKTRYFTSRVKGSYDPDKPKRQSKYLDAINTLFPEVETQEGIFQAFPSKCNFCKQELKCALCGNGHIKPNEKKTDVNIATALLVDAFRNLCDTQILISGDGDYENTLIELRRLFPSKEVIIAFPPKRKNNQLIGSTRCTDSYTIPEEAFKHSQFPDTIKITSSAGNVVTITKPPSWN
jgi:hypothetical protein